MSIESLSNAFRTLDPESGLGQTAPHGEVTGSYGSFGTPTAGMNVSFGSAKVGDFLSLSGLRSGRFLDGPEFAVLHDKGNEEKTNPDII